MLVRPTVLSSLAAALQLVAAWWIACSWTSVAPAADPAAPPQFVVSSFDLGTVPQVKAMADELVAEFTAQEWCTALSNKTAKSWNEVPAGVDPRQWVSIVTVGYGNQAEAYAFLFDGPQGAARLVAHAPNPKGTLRGVPYWYSPFVKLLNGFRIGYTATPASQPPLQIEIREVAETADAKTANKPGFDDALTIGPEKILPPLKPIILAAACRAGWSPTLASTPSSASSRAVVEVQVLDQACSFRILLTHGGKESIIDKPRVSWEEFHEQLTALFRLPLGDRQIHDVVRLAPGRVELLAAVANRIAYLVDDELAALDAATGREAWRLRIPQNPAARTKRIEQYTVRREASDGRPRLFRASGTPAEIAWTDGAVQPLKELPAEAGDIVAGRRFVFNADETLSAIDPQDGSTKWSFAAGDRLFQPPQEFAGRVLVVTKQNRLAVLDPASGNVAAETIWPTWIIGLEIVKYAEGQHLALTDLNGGATLLNERLQTVWQARVPSRPTGRPALVMMPATFQKGVPAAGGDDLLTAIAADAVKPQPFFVLTDADGFLYRLTLPEKK